MERRSSLRKPIHLDAVVRLEGGAKWPCIVADYCDQGMFLKFSMAVSKALESDQSVGPNRGFTICFQDRHGATQEIAAEPAHLLKGAAGIRFRGRFDEAVAALGEFADDTHPVSYPREEIQHIVEECVEAVQQYIAPLLHEFWPKLVSGIKDAALEARTDQLANATMEVANKVERGKMPIQQRFLDAIRDPMGRHLAPEKNAEMVENLALIDKGEFEDWLTTRVLITKSETQYRSLLLPLKMRLDEVGLSDKKHHENPLGPSLIVNAYQRAITGIVVEEGSIEKLLFRLFEREVMGELESLYEELNQILIRHNVLPELDLTRQIRKSPEPSKPLSPDASSPEPKPAPETDGQPSDEAAPDDPIGPPQFVYGSTPSASMPVSAEQQSQTATQPPFFSPQSPPDAKASEGQPPSAPATEISYRNVVGLVRSLQTPVSAPSTDRPTASPGGSYSADELARGLSTLQAAALQSEVDASRGDGLMKRVLENLRDGGDSAKQIHEDQQVAIDVVDRFFDSLHGNPRLTQLAKQQLHRLEIPVLKMLLQDEGFFEDGTNSVRAVMNRIAQLGAKGSRLTPNHQNRIESLVRRIVEEFEDDTQVFDQVLTELNELVDRQNQLYKKNVERVAAAAEGVHRVEQAKSAVARTLNQKMAHQAVPLAVQTLVQNGWQDLLQLTHIRHGENSKEWRENLQVIDELLAYGADASHPLDMKAVLPRIQSGLQEVSGSQDAPLVVREQLKRFIDGVKQGSFESVEVPPLDVPESEDEQALQNVKKSKELKHWILRAKSIAVGTWLQFNRPDEETQYMRLVWIAKGYSKFVCVNHQGMKVVELGLFKFAGYLKDGIVMPDPDYEVPIVNQGLDDMVKDVYDKLAFEASHDKVSGLAKRSEFCREVRAIMKQGDRTAACSLLYIRFAAIQEGEVARLSNSFVKRVAATLEELASEGAVIGRLSATDFAMFQVNDDLDLINLRCSELLVELCQSDADKEQPLLVAVGESRGQLGFNNPESMIRHAARPIAQASQAHRAQRQDGGEGGESSAAAVVAEQVKIEEQDERSSADLSRIRFDIFCQKAMSLAPDSVHEEQYELLCSEAGTGLSFEPENEAQARALDQWWVATLVEKFTQGDPEWDGIDYMRVKLSGYAFRDDRFKDQLLDLVDREQLDPRRIWFDLYDLAVVDNIHAAADMIKHLMAKGFRFCLDHFGTRRSPFPLLKMLPVDMIKIDEGYIDLLNDEEADEVATDSIVELAHQVGKEVLASSVDSAICLQRMKKLCVDYVQGSTIADYELLSEAAAQ